MKGGSKKYEELLDEYPPLRKPGYVSPRERAEAERKAFAARLIEALKFAEASSPRASPAQLAQRLHDKLQYDFPVATWEELQALVSEVTAITRPRSSGGKAQAATAAAQRLAPTTILVSNLAEAAKRAGAKPSGAVGGGSSSGGVPQAQGNAPAGDSRERASNAGAAASAAPADLWQLAAATYCLRYVTHLLRQPPEAAHALLVRYEAPAEPVCLEPPQPPAPPGALMAAAAGLPPAPCDARLPPNTYAAVEDGDDYVYEEMGLPDPPAAPAPGPPRARAAAAPFSAETVRAKLVSLGCHLDAECLSHDAAWQGTGLMADVVVGVAAACSAEEACGLEPLVAAWCGVAAARMAASPGDMELLPQLWGSLGLGGAAGGDSRREGLLVAFTANLAGQCKSQRALSRLAHHVHSALLPCLGAAMARAGRRAGETEKATLMAACEVLEAYARHYPGKSVLQSRLAGAGVLRSLAVAFIAHALEHDAEPLRRCAVLCAAASADVCAWLAAVPGFAELAGGDVLQHAEVVEHHGALWSLLLGPALPGGGKAPAARLAALGEGRGNVLQLARTSRILQLLADAKQAAGGRCIIDPQLHALLSRMAVTLRQAQQQQSLAPDAVLHSDGTATGDSGAAASDGGDDASTAFMDGGGDSTTSSHADGSVDEIRTPLAADGTGREALRDEWGAARDEKQHALQALCLRLLKQLIVDERGKND